MSCTRWKRLLLAALPPVALGGVLLLIPRIAQPAAYHRFADQTAPFLSLPLILWLFPARYSRGADWIKAMGWYGAAKVCELLDRTIFDLSGEHVSGHTLKHICAGLGFATLARMLAARAGRDGT